MIAGLLRVLGLVATVVMRHARWGKFTKASNGKWFTKDLAGHGGSVAKQYRQEGKRLIHEADLDAAGKVIPKAKGRKGEIVEMSDLIGIGGGGGGK